MSNVSQYEIAAQVPVTTYETRLVNRVVIDLADEGEVRRFHRQLLAGAKNVEGVKSEAFANALIAALGVTEESAAKR